MHAAAGGVGLILCQWAKHLGATVIGTVSTDEKAAVAKAHGCDHPIVYTREDFVARVKEITDGAGVPVVYDSVGLATLEGSMKCLRPRGVLASFGEASGDPDPGAAAAARRHGLDLAHPSARCPTTRRRARNCWRPCNDLFDVVMSGKVKIEISHEYPLRDAPRAHADIEARKTTGSIVLIA